MANAGSTVQREPWNKGKLVGQKAPFKLKDIWALRVRLTATAALRPLKPPPWPRHRLKAPQYGPRDSPCSLRVLGVVACPCA